MYNTMETSYVASPQPFVGIKVQLARLRMRPQALIIQSPQLHRVQHQVLLLLEQGAEAAGPPLLPVLPASGHIDNVIPSAPLQRHQRYHLEMVAGKAPLLAKSCGDVKNLEGWIQQMDPIDG